MAMRDEDLAVAAIAIERAWPPQMATVAIDIGASNFGLTALVLSRELGTARLIAMLFGTRNRGPSAM
jgi:hypothetical protein